MRWKMKMKFALCCLVMAGFTLSSVYASAEGLRFGKMAVEPEAGLEAEYNDNIFLDDENERDDVIFRFTPGVAFSYSGNPGNYVKTGYDLELGMYVDYDDNNYHSHNPYLSLGFKAPAGFYLNFDDNFKYSSDPHGSENQYNEGVKTKRWNNTAEIVAGWEFERITVEGAYKNYLIRYMEDDDKWQDRIDHQFAGTVYFKITHKTSVFGQFRYTMAEYDAQNDGIADSDGNPYWTEDNSEDNKLYEYFAGFKFEPGQKLTGQIKVGYGERSFDNELSPMLDTSGNQRRYEDQSTWVATWVAETSVIYKPVQRTRISFDLSRSYKGSPDTYSSSYIDTLIAIALKQGLSEKISVKAGADWNRTDYFDEDTGQPRRYFDIYTLNAGLEWEILRWLTAGLEYEFKTKNASDSLYETEEYQNNKITVYVEGQL